MPLNVALLISGFQAAGLKGLVPPPATVTRSFMADQFLSAYGDYASAAQSCTALAPTLVDVDGNATAKLREVFAANPPDFETPAQGWADALSLYWDGAIFGTGVVTIPGVKALLSEPLATLWKVSKEAPTPPDPASILAAMATLIDAFTKTVAVADPIGPCVGTIV